MKGVDTNDYIKKRIGDYRSYNAVDDLILVGDAHYNRGLGRFIFDVVTIGCTCSITDRGHHLDYKEMQ